MTYTLSNEKYLQAHEIIKDLDGLREKLVIFQSGNFGELSEDAENKIFALRRSIGELKEELNREIVEYTNFNPNR